MNLLDELRRLRPRECLGYWTGILAGNRHATVRADLVRLRLLYKKQDGTIFFCEKLPYRPASVYRNGSPSEDLYRMVFDCEPVYRILSGSGKGRFAQKEDLSRSEKSKRADTCCCLGRLPELAGVPGREGRLALEAMHQAALALPEEPQETRDPQEGVPSFVLSSPETSDMVFLREAGPKEDPPEEIPVGDGHVLRPCDWWFGQGVWCVFPRELGSWFRGPTELFLHSSPSVSLDLTGLEKATDKERKE